MPGQSEGRKHLLTIAKGVFICTLAWNISLVYKASLVPEKPAPKTTESAGGK
jgi:hypothetical protein